MRTPLLCTAFVGLFACAGELSDVGGDDQQSAVCGNGAKEAGEACDDGNTASGDGCSATCAIEDSETPRLTASVDKLTVDTELAKAETVTLNLLSAGGFAGTVNVAASLVDGAGAPITTMTLMGPASVDVTANATTPVQYMVTIPTDATGTALTATLKLDVTSTAGDANLTSTINVAPIYTITIDDGTLADDPKHPLAGKVFSVRRGAKLRMVNLDTTTPTQHVSHGGGGIPHENLANGQPGGTYEVDTTPLAPGGGRTFGCHTHDTPTYAQITIL